MKDSMHTMGLRMLFLLATLALAPLGSAAEATDKPQSENNVVAMNNDGNFIKASLSRDTIQRRLMADRILVEKGKRKLSLFYRGEIIKEYDISLGRNPVGAKTEAGDNKTPEGLYYIDYRVTNSDYHRALHISYPNRDDRLRAADKGVSPGGSIMLHGLKNRDKDIAYLHGYFDWTNGCIAVTNTEIEEIWSMVPNGTAIYILP